MPKGTVNTELVKQAYSKIPYDADMLKEFQACCDPNDGPMHFMTKFVRIQHPTKGGIDFVPFQFQCHAMACVMLNVYMIIAFHPNFVQKLRENRGKRTSENWFRIDECLQQF